MPKSIVVEPKDVFSKSSIHFSDIPLNAYDRTVEEELVHYSTEDFIHIWQDMCAIREFESILNEIKIKGAYKGVTYNVDGAAPMIVPPTSWMTNPPAEIAFRPSGSGLLRLTPPIASIQSAKVLCMWATVAERVIKADEQGSISSLG